MIYSTTHTKVNNELGWWQRYYNSKTPVALTKSIDAHGYQRLVPIGFYKRHYGSQTYRTIIEDLYYDHTF